MIQINLLPDIKQEFLKSQRTKRVIIAVSILVSGAFVAVTALIGIWVGSLSVRLNSLQGDIDNKVSELQSIENLDEIVTIQNQLETLPGLHDQKIAMQRLFEYLQLTVPNEISLTSVYLSNEDEPEAEIKGFASGSLPGDEDTDNNETETSTEIATKQINVFIDTLKNAKFLYLERGSDPETTEPTELRPFLNVRVERYSLSEDISSFEILLSFDPIIFDDTLEFYELQVPNIITTVSELYSPGTPRDTNLFEEIIIEEELPAGEESQ